MKAIIFENNLLKVLISFVFSKITKRVYLGFFSPLRLLENNNDNITLSDTDVLVETILCGYCGTDKSILTYNMSVKSSVFVDTKRHKEKKIYLGHEIVGKVKNIGKKVINFSVGDHVILDSKIRDEAITAKNKYGGWSSQFVRDQSQLININRNLDIEKAVLIEPLACAFGALRKSNIKSKDHILILGGGIIGQGLLVLLRYFYKKEVKISIATKSTIHKNIIDKHLPDNIIFNEDIFIASKKILKTFIKKNYSNQILKTGYDKIFDCTGDEKLLNKLLRLCNNNGTIILTGTNMKLSKIDPTPIWHREINLIGSHAYEESYPDLKEKTLKYLEGLILNGEIKIDNLKVNKVNIKNWKNLFKENHDSIKNTISFL